MEEDKIRSIIKLRKVRNFLYRKPIIKADMETGGVICDLDENSKPIALGNISLLLNFSVTKKDSMFLCVVPVDVANAFLVETALNGDAQSADNTKQYSSALREYFQFLADEGLEWDKIPELKRDKPTYRFKRHLERSANIKVRNEEDRTDDPMAVSTVKAYMRVITSFYKYLIAKNYHFANKPFEYEKVTVNMAATSASQMSAQSRKVIITTDLRIKAKSQKGSIPNHLRAMTVFEWETFDDALRNKGVGLRTVRGKEVQVKISTEIKYQLLCMRYAGLRIEEAANLRKLQLFKPHAEQYKRGYVEIKISPANFNKSKGNKARVIEIPSYLMQMLFAYTKSATYRKREKKYRQSNPTHSIAQTPLFLNDKGENVSEKSATTRFGELRRAIENDLGQKFPHKAHNLRATYAVFRIRNYAKAMITLGRPPAEAWEKALDHVKNNLGHESVATTALYLKQAQDGPLCAHAKAEDILEFADEVASSKFDFGGVE